MKKDDRSWLLIKKQDEYAVEKDILTKNKSVISGKTIEMLRKANGRKKSNTK